MSCCCLSFNSCFLSEERSYSSMNNSTCSLSTHNGVSAMWSSNVMEIAMAHTFSNHQPRAQDVLLLNELRTRRKRTKPDVARELKESVVKHSWNLYRPSLQSGQYLRRISQKTVLARFPQPCASIARHVKRSLAEECVCTYVATSTKYEFGVFMFGQVGWAVGQALDFAASGLPHGRRRSVHQELPVIFGGACKVQELARVGVCSDLLPSC